MEKSVYDIIVSPLITENSMDMAQNKKYAFKVMPSATKPEIAAAIEAVFPGTKVKSVNTMNVNGKVKRVRYQAGRTAAWKKAIVTLTEDSQTIAFFDGLN